MIKILGIYRLPMFSNNAVEADRLILDQSLEALALFLGSHVSVEMMEEQEVCDITTAQNFDLIFTMAQSHAALSALDRFFKKSLVVNSTDAIRNCYRKLMAEKLITADVGFVPFQTLLTSQPEKLKAEATSALWVKRSDFHAISDDDVSLAEGKEEAIKKLAAFQRRGVKEVIIQPHIHGNIYKFYGVRDHFFKPILVRKILTTGIEPDWAKLQAAAFKASKLLGLYVYGGDVIVDDFGKFHMIDLNDWPSFRICRPEAAKAIAQLGVDLVARLESTQPSFAAGLL